MPVAEVILKRWAVVVRTAVGVLPMTKFRTRIGAPGPDAKMLVAPIETSTFWLFEPIPANFAGWKPDPIKITLPVLVRVPLGAMVTVPAVVARITEPNSIFSTRINSSGRTIATCASAFSRSAVAATAGHATTNAAHAPISDDPRRYGNVGTLILSLSQQCLNRMVGVYG